MYSRMYVTPAPVDSCIRGQGPGLVNVLCAERKTNKFLTLGARKTTPTIFAYTNQRIGDEHTDAAAFDADGAAVGASDRRVPAERDEGGRNQLDFCSRSK